MTQTEPESAARAALPGISFHFPHSKCPVRVGSCEMREPRVTPTVSGSQKHDADFFFSFFKESRIWESAQSVIPLLQRSRTRGHCFSRTSTSLVPFLPPQGVCWVGDCTPKTTLFGSVGSAVMFSTCVSPDRDRSVRRERRTVPEMFTHSCFPP